MDHGSQEVSCPLSLLLIVTVRSVQCSHGRPNPATIDVRHVQPLAKSAGYTRKDGAEKRSSSISSTALWGHPEQKQRIGAGELNQPLFIEEFNAAEYFSVSSEVVEYLPMKSTQHTHAKMKRTAVSL